MGVEWPLSNKYKVYSAYSPTIVEFIGEIIGEYLIRELLSTEKNIFPDIKYEKEAWSSHLVLIYGVGV